jgi:hypothetical protein
MRQAALEAARILRLTAHTGAGKKNACAAVGKPQKT